MVPKKILSLLLLLSLGIAQAVHGLVSDDRGIKGRTFHIPKNKKTRVQGLIKASNKQVSASACSPLVPLLPVNGSVPQFNPNALPGAFFPNPFVSNSLTPPPQTLGVTFVAGQNGMSPEFFGTPPDTYGVIGLTQFVMGDNTGIVSFDRTGKRDGIMDNEGASVTNMDGDFNIYITNADARIFYDRLADKFVSLQLNMDYEGAPQTVGNNGFTIAVSDSGVISDDTTWTVLSVFDYTIIPDSNGCPSNVAPGGVFGDYPTMGIDQNALYVSIANYVQNNGEPLPANVPWLSNTLFVIQKKSLYKGDGPVVITAFPDITKDTNGNFVGDQQDYRANSTVFGLNNFEDPCPKFGYAIATDPVYFGKLRLYRILDAGSDSPSLVGPIIFDVMQTYAKESDPIGYSPFPTLLYGNFGKLEFLDDRLADTSHINKKQIYTGHCLLVNSNGICDPTTADRSGIRWYQLDVTGDPTGQGKGCEKATTVPALVQAGTLFDPSMSDPLFYKFPAILSNSQEDISICGTVSGNKQPISAFYVGKAGTDPKDGTLNVGPTPLVLGVNVYAIGSGSFTRSLGLGGGVGVAFPPVGQRWGDMSYSSLDPLDKKTIWTIQEIAVDGLETLVVAQLQAP